MIIKVLCAVVSFNLSLAFLAWSERQSALQSTLDVSRVAVAQSLRHADHVMDTVDRTMSGVAEAVHLYLNSDGDEPFYVHRLLVRRHAITPTLRSLIILSRPGKVIFDSTSAQPKPVDLSDRDYVQQHMAHSDDVFVIGKPITSRLNGEWVVPVSRRIDDRFGRLTAIVAGGIDPSIFVDPLASSGLPKGSRVMIRSSAGHILACLPKATCWREADEASPFPPGADQPPKLETAMHASYVGAATGPSARGVSEVYGMSVAMTVDADAVLAEWRSHLVWFVGIGVVGSVAISILSYLLDHQVRRRRQALRHLANANSMLEERVANRTAQLEERGIALQRSEERMRAFISTARDAMIILSDDARIVSMNPAAERMFGHTLETLAGESVSVLIPQRLSIGHGLLVEGLSTLNSGTENCREMIGQHMNGDEFPIEVTIGSSESHGERIFVAVMRDISQRKAQEEALWRLAHFDGLTGTLNRRAFMDKAQDLVEVSRRYGRPMAVLMVDADHFKAVNDTFGHQTGDEVLKTLAAVLKTELRTSDLLGRLGGEEFAVIAPEISQEGAIALSQRLLQKVRAAGAELAKNFESAGKLQITVSIGVAVFAEGDTAESLLRKADQALYTAKRGGRDRLHPFHVPFDEERMA